MTLPFESGNIKLTSPFGKRSLNGTISSHNGIDLVGLQTKTVCAVTSGRVLWSKIVTDKNNLTWQWGNYVAITGADGHTCYYCHLDKRFVSVGQYVEAGTPIGIMGNTGYSFGAHLHFEVRKNNITPVNAADYLSIKNAVQTVNASDYYANQVCSKCGLTAGTRSYLNAYKFAPELWRKLALSQKNP